MVNSQAFDRMQISVYLFSKILGRCIQLQNVFGKVSYLLSAQ